MLRWPIEVRGDVGARIVERIADAGLRAEMDDPVDLGAGQRLFERLVIREIDLHEAEGSGVQPRSSGQPLLLQPRIVIGIEIVDADHALAALEQRRGDMVADEAGGAGDEDDS